VACLDLQAGVAQGEPGRLPAARTSVSRSGPEPMAVVRQVAPHRVVLERLRMLVWPPGKTRCPFLSDGIHGAPTHSVVIRLIVYDRRCDVPVPFRQ
jgi:hypothetical protein